jgi:hypothetical protein
MSRVAAFNSTHLVLERPMPWDLFVGFANWEVHAYRPTISDVGVEGFSIVCMSQPYRGKRLDAQIVGYVRAQPWSC